LSNPVETSLYDFIKAAADVVNDEETPDEESPAFGVIVHDHVYRKIEDENFHYIQIGHCDSDFAPSPGAESVEEFDANVVVITLSRVPAADVRDRQAAMTKALDLAKWVAKLLLDDPTMGNRVNDSRVLRCMRDWASINGKPYAVTNVPLIVNETGS
jgi:hypothetical protein